MRVGSHQPPSCHFIQFSLVGVLLFAPTAWADNAKSPPVLQPPPAVEKSAPENIDDLKAIQTHVKKIFEKVVPCTVGVIIGASQGSGVIISKDGHVLTAGHVSGQPGRDAFLVMPDGKRLKGKTLGANKGIDSGLIQITDPGIFPFLEMGNSADLKPGQWCIATGHPGGFRPGRTPVLRLGRVINANGSLIQTDCALVGGDSGGPLFDMHGKVIGIHSRIGGAMTANIHVPVDTYRDTWDRLAKGEAWGERLGRNNVGEPYMGVKGYTESKECRIAEVAVGSPADKAGLKPEDLVIKFDGQKVDRYEDLQSLIARKRPGDEVTIEVRRGDESKALKVTMGRKMS